MAFNGTRPRGSAAAPPPPPPHDENARNLIGKASAHGGSLKHGGLKPQQPFERKILSDISNKLHALSSKSAAGTPVSAISQAIHADKTGADNVVGNKGFSILADANLAAPKPPSQSFLAKAVDEIPVAKSKLPVKIPPTVRVPLKDIRNAENLCQDHANSENAEWRKQSIHYSTKFRFVPCSEVKLTDETQKKIAAWAKEGIERVHFSGQDIEALQAKTEEEEMERRIAQVLSYRTELPLLPRRPLDPDFWNFGGVPKLDPVENLEDDEDPLAVFNGAKAKMIDPADLLIKYSDFYADTLPPRFSKSWPEVGEDSVSQDG